MMYILGHDWPSAVSPERIAAQRALLFERVA
jgi:hypothetical protein